MFCDVREHIADCKLCKQYKRGNDRNQIDYTNITSYAPFEKICLDICGPTKKSSAGFEYVLAIIDHFSKFCVLVPLKCLSAKTLADCLWDNWISKYGTSTSIITDNAKCFRADVFKTLTELCRISHVFSPPYHQQANGLVERLFGTVKPLIKIATEQYAQDWHKGLTHIEMALRSAPQSKTGFSPYEIVFGRKMRLPWDTFKATSERNIEAFMKRNLKKLDLVNEAVRQNGMGYILKHDKYRKVYQNSSIKIGDFVMARNFLPNRYNDKKFDGNLIVIEKVGNSAFVVESVDKNKRFIRHYNDLKKLSNAPQKDNKTKVTSVWSTKSRKVNVG